MDRPISSDTEGLICEKMADTDALLPRLDVFAIRTPAVGGNHASYGTVHEDADTSTLLADAVIEGPNKIRAEDSLVRPDYFGMTGIVHESSQRPAFNIKDLNDMASRVIQVLRVVIVGYFAPCPAGGDFDVRRL